MSDGGQTPVMGEAERAAARELSLRGVRPPVKVPGYEHEQFLGHGAYGEVWVAVNRNSGRKVAIKFYTRRGGLDWASLAREVEKLRYLFSDRYVVQLFEVGWESDPPYYVMEFMENGSLEDLAAGRPPAGSRRRRLFPGSCRGPGPCPRQGYPPLRPEAGQHPARSRPPAAAGRLRAIPADQRDVAGPGHTLLHGPRAGRPRCQPRRPMGRVRPRRGHVPYAHRQAAALPARTAFGWEPGIAAHRLPQTDPARSQTDGTPAGAGG